NFFVKQDIKIDYLHIDAGHSYEDVKQDFDLYSTLLNDNGMISIHDTDEKYQKEFIVTEDEKEYFQNWDGPARFIKDIGPEWKQINFFNTGITPMKPASTGLTLLQRAK
ncbi:MAG: class I SAM-dependent methyltransferase, partial [Flavobacteriaceae bacterium]|nr:class I SAM-dependent methyltransferase [Flavobacteriaceae bacterium]